MFSTNYRIYVIFKISARVMHVVARMLDLSIVYSCRYFIISVKRQSKSMSSLFEMELLYEAIMTKKRTFSKNDFILSLSH